MNKFKTIDFAAIPRSERYYLMTSTIIPRPIAVVATTDLNGNDNLAPFSYFNAVSSDPPCLMFSVTNKRDGSKKDTLKNIELSKEFVIHISVASQKEIIDQISDDLPYGQSERAKQGLTLTPSTWIKTQRVKEFPIAYECVLEKLIEFGANTVVFGKILGAHVEEKLLEAGPKLHVSPFLLDPLSRLGQDYAKISPLK